MKKVAWFILSIVMVVLTTLSASALMETKIGETIIDGKSILEQDWATLTVNPTTAFSIPSIRNFTQRLSLCNNAEDSGYFYLDYYFNQDLASHSLTKISFDKETVTYQEPLVNCVSEGDVNEGTNTTVCTTTYVEKNKTLDKTSKTVLDEYVKNEWSDQVHYVREKGEFLKAGECNYYDLNYKTTKFDLNGKWNFRVWANIEDDWTCIQDGSCPFDYHLDPTYSTAFTYKQNITINNTLRSINNYTVEILLNLSNHNFNLTQPDGDDVIFVNFDETTALGCYKESFDNTTLGNYSVLITNFTNATNTTIWMYFGNTTIDNQCPEINSAYLLADLMNDSAINTSIWNLKVGSTWSASSTNGAYLTATTAGQFCQGAGSTSNAIDECSLIANTSGVWKQSQALEIKMRNRDLQDGDVCGWGAGVSHNMSLGGTMGSPNMSWQGFDTMFTRAIGQNGSTLVSNTRNRTNYWINTEFIKVNNNDARTLYAWYNSSGLSDEIDYANSIPNSSVLPNSYLNESNRFSLLQGDGSGGTACSGIYWEEVRVRAYLNGTPTLLFGTPEVVNVVPNAADFTNETWNDFGWESGLANFSVNVSIDQSVYNNISDVNFSYNGTIYTESVITNTSSGNWTQFNISLRLPLVVQNGTNYSFNWSVTQTGNGTELTAYNTNRTQLVYWGWWVNNVSWTSVVSSGQSNTWRFNVSKIIANPPSFDHNVTLEWNLTNQSTNASLIVNSTTYEDWTFVMNAPVVYADVVVNWTDWLQMNHSIMTVNRQNISNSQFSNGTQTVLAGINLSITNETWETTGLFDSGGVSNYSINVTIDQNVYNNISAVNFSIQGFVYSSAQISNTSVGNWTRFNISVYTPLVQVNGTSVNFNWSFYQQGNVTNALANSSNRTQSVRWGWYVNNLSYTSPIPSASPNNVIVNFTKHVVGGVGLLYNVTNEFNSTINRTATQLITNASGYEEWNITFATPIVYVQTLVNTKGWLNISFNGSYATRDPTFVQVINPFSNQSYETPLFETSLANFTLNVSNSSAISNVNFTWNSSQFNGTNIDNTTAGTTTIFNISLRLPLIPSNQSNYTIQWNITLSNGSIIVTNLTNQTLLISYYPNNIHRNTSVPEGDIQNQIINVTKHIFANGIFEVVNLEYNQTNISSALYVNGTNYEDYNAVFITPFVSVDTVVQERGWLNITQSLGSISNDNYLRNTTNNFSQTILNINVSSGNCSGIANTTAVLNFTFFDELTNASISENGSSQITLWSSLQTVNQTFGFAFNNSLYHEICLQGTVFNFTANYNVQFGDVGLTYTTREYWARLQNIDNQTDNITLYNLQNTNATEIIFNVVDNNDDPIQNMIVQVLKFNISNNSYKVVDTEITDFDGKARLRLFQSDDYYKVNLIDGGNNIVLETINFKLLFNEYFIKVVPTGVQNIQTVIKLNQIPHNLTFDNGSKIVQLTWVDIEGITSGSQSCLEIVNLTNSSGQIINKQCSSNTSGAFSFNLTNVNGTYVGKYVVGTNSFLIDIIDIVLIELVNFGRDGLWLAFIVIGTLAMIGLAVDPTVSIILTLVGIVSMTMIGMLPINWIALSGIVVAGLFVAFTINKVQ